MSRARASIKENQVIIVTIRQPFARINLIIYLAHLHVHLNTQKINTLYYNRGPRENTNISLITGRQSQ